MIDMMELFKWLAIIVLGISIGVFFASAIFFHSYQEQKSTFIFKIFNSSLFGRQQEITRLRGHILTGQSSAIVSIFEEDRTALLGYLSDPSNSKELYSEQADKLVFSLLDIHWLLQKEGEKECQPLQFWEHALKPLEDELKPHPSVFKSYQVCKENQFDEHYLDKLIMQLKQEGWRFVLMLDRFDNLLNSNLYNPAFFAILRQLASSRSPSSLSLIISGNISLKQFHEKTKSMNPKGSPYFNFMENGEIVLKALSDSEVDELLSEMSFSKQEAQFIKDIAGGHPHFIQLAATLLQTTKEGATKESQETQLLEIAKKEFVDRVKNEFSNIMSSWNSDMCKNIVSLIKDNKVPESFRDELAMLEKQEIFIKNENEQWQVVPSVLEDFIKNRTEQELCR
jgi:hypothetical protein